MMKHSKQQSNSEDSHSLTSQIWNKKHY